jgi:hypothetical protein
MVRPLRPRRNVPSGTRLRTGPRSLPPTQPASGSEPLKKRQRTKEQESDNDDVSEGILYEGSRPGLGDDNDVDWPDDRASNVIYFSIFASWLFD